MSAIYTPSEWQSEFHSLRTHEALGAGSAGPGKTTCLRFEFLEQLFTEDRRARLSGDEPERIEPMTSKGWWLYLRRTNGMLEQELERTHQAFSQLCPKLKIRNDPSGGRTYVFPPSGYRYQLGACCDIGDYQKFMSNEYTGVAFDEAVQFDHEQYDQITSRVRTADQVLVGMLKRRAMSNPMMELDSSSSFIVREPDWVRRRFVDPAPEGRRILTRWIEMDDGERLPWTSIYLPARLSDNPDAMFRRDYELTLKTKPKHICEALLRGDWYVSVGGYYSDTFDPAVHVVRPFRIPKSWGRFRSMDWGYKTFGAVLWWAVDAEDNWIIEREFTFKGLKADEAAREVKAIEIEMGLWDGRLDRSTITGPADTQLWEERGDVGKTKGEIFEEAGVPWTKCDKNQQNAGEAISGKLKDRRGGVPGLVIFESCTRTIMDMKLVRCDMRNPNKPADSGVLHWHDAVMYGANYASRGVISPFDDERDEEPKRTVSRGRTGFGW
jgi:hypothetical protein